jgi:2-isopropylmalate synthase
MRVVIVSSSALLLLTSPILVSGFVPCRSFITTSSKSHSSSRLLASQVEKNERTTATSQTSSSSSSGDDWIAKSLSEGNVDETVAAAAAVPCGSLLDSCVVGPKHVLMYDTTLRDGTQGESISASCNDKIKIATRLAQFDMDYIEAGWPGSNPKDAEFFARAPTELPPSVQSKLVAFGSTRRKGIAAKDDAQIQALIDSNVPTICMVAKAHSWQVTEILRATLEENLEMIRDSVQYLTHVHGKTVLVDLEHFFDGYAADPEYCLQCCQVAVDAGAKCLVLCDTNGGSMPWQVGDICRHMVSEFEPRQVTIGIHVHNDCGMAVANSVSAVNAGVGLVQGTINGIGERTGNADLCSIIPSLALHVQSKMTCQSHLSEMTQLSRYVDELLNRTPNSAAPFVGASAFAHKGGLHVAAMERNPLSYQHVEPELVGNQQRILISELSGRQNILGKMQTVFAGESALEEKGKMSDRALAILNRVKALEHKGYTFEGADASVHLMILHSTNGYCPPFQVLDYSAQVYDYNMDSATRVLAQSKGDQVIASSSTARATVKVRTVYDDPITNELSYQENLQVSDGNGPVDALAKALMRALVPAHPYLNGIDLVDYKVRILDANSATAAATRVMIEFRDTETEKQWTTVSVDTNVISASLNALVDGFEYALVEHAQLCMLCEDAY